MALTYYKRFRMEFDLTCGPLSTPTLREPYRFIPWHPELAEAHGQAMYNSFHDEIDAEVFPCLGDADGCSRLMNEIAQKQGFLPAATWLLAFPGPSGWQHCGTIQGVLQQGVIGAVQNLGVVPPHRGCGLGRALLLKALEGFRQGGATHATLEVTAQNVAAICLYRAVGFRKARIVYKAVEAAMVG